MEAPHRRRITPRRRAALRGRRHRRARRGARGDRRAQRLPRAGRRHRHQHVPHVSAARDAIREVTATTDGRRPRHGARGVRPRRAARRPRQLRRDPQPDAGRDRAPDRPAGSRASASATVMAEALAAGDRRELCRRRHAGRGHDPHRGAGRVRRRAWRAPRTRQPAPATCSPRAAAAAREALARTPEQLQALRDAGVVDAGGRGLSVILDAAETVLTGRRPAPVTDPIGKHQIPVPRRRADDLTEDGPSYEVMYLLDADDDAIPALRATLAPARRLPGRRRRRGPVERPRPRRRRRRRDRGRHRRRAGRTGSGSPTSPSRSPAARQPGAPTRRGRRIVAVAAGPGPGGAVRRGRRGRGRGRPGPPPVHRQVLEAITACGAAEVVVLPNDADSVRVAEIAARTAEADRGG